MVCTAILFCLVNTVSGNCKNTLGRPSASSGHITKLEQSTFLQISRYKTDFKTLFINFIEDCGSSFITFPQFSRLTHTKAFKKDIFEDVCLVQFNSQSTDVYGVFRGRLCFVYGFDIYCLKLVVPLQGHKEAVVKNKLILNKNHLIC